MRINRNLKTIKNSKPTALIIGSFDGLHLGHQAIIEKLICIAKQNNLIAYVLFFEPLPKEFFLKEKSPLRIYDFRNKVINLCKLGIQNIICQKFDQKFADIEAEKFVREYLIERLNMKHIIIGDDFRFGKKRQGDSSFLQKLAVKYNFEIDRINKISIANLNNQRISSSQVRQAILKHDLTRVSKLLGKSLKINSRVIHGEKNARKIGFRTANQKLPQNSVLKGVYLTKVYLDDEVFYGISNAGRRPTLDGKNNLLETHIFDFDKNIYGKHITTEIKTFIRAEKKFNSLEELKFQIFEDIKIARKIVS